MQSSPGIKFIWIHCWLVQGAFFFRPSKKFLLLIFLHLVPNSIFHVELQRLSCFCFAFQPVSCCCKFFLFFFDQLSLLNTLPQLFLVFSMRLETFLKQKKQVSFFRSHLSFLQCVIADVVGLALGKERLFFRVVNWFLGFCFDFAFFSNCFFFSVCGCSQFHSPLFVVCFLQEACTGYNLWRRLLFCWLPFSALWRLSPNELATRSSTPSWCPSSRHLPLWLVSSSSSAPPPCVTRNSSRITTTITITSHTVAVSLVKCLALPLACSLVPCAFWDRAAAAGPCTTKAWSAKQRSSTLWKHPPANKQPTRRRTTTTSSRKRRPCLQCTLLAL